MRKVIFQKYEKLVPTGIKTWSEFIYEGVFHQWAAQHEDGGEGFGNYTVAIIELSDGSVEEVYPTRLKFVV